MKEERIVRELEAIRKALENLQDGLKLLLYDNHYQPPEEETPTPKGNLNKGDDLPLDRRYIN